MEETKLFSSFDAGILLRAIEFAAEKHRDQRRKGVDAPPYINHPIGVASLIVNIGGVQDLTVLVAAVLHDTIEDTCTSPGELEKHFGVQVSDIVLEVTDDKCLPKLQRKQLQVEHSPHLSRSAKLIKLADKSSNIKEVTENPPAGWSVERRREYLDWAENVVAGCRGTSRALELHFDKTLKEAKKKLQTL